MIKILFLCHGNICRSPAAEFVMKKLVDEAGRRDEFHIESAALTHDALGCGVYPPMAEVLRANGIDTGGKRARLAVREDYDLFDLIIGMDDENKYDMRWLWREDPDDKLHLLLDYTDTPRDVSDPWYTRDFRKAYEDILMGCESLLETL